MDEKKAEALRLYGLGVPIRRIAKVLHIPRSTVARWLKEPIGVMGEKKEEKHLQDELWDRVLGLLTFSKEEKGRTRVLSIAQTYRLFEVELQTKGIKSERTFRRVLEQVIKQRLGSWEALELKRRDKSEIAEYRKSKGKQRREKGEWEIDATGYTFKGERYFILAVRERWSGAFLSCMVAKVREDTQAQHYNKAFNSLDLARFLISLFKEYGLPERIITDNEAVLKAEIITRGLEHLNIPITRTKPYNPSQKLIERAFRDLKDHLRYFTSTHTTFEDALKAAIESYNKSEHKYEHFNAPVIPEHLHATIEYKQVSEDELRKAFRERFIRTVRNNTIVIDNLKYEFVFPFEERAGEIGRNRKAPTVVCYRDIENATILEVWDEKETRPLGIARLISQDAPSLDPTEIKELRNKEKRIERRKRKLKEELIEIEQQEQQTQNTADFFEVFNHEPSSQPAQPQPEGEELDPIKLFLGGEEQ
ncbi:Integrase catalytic region [Hydrogenobacter thermophilus TK-6]|uniref:Pol protein n=1 Tax=Hydrogenobacter thermophilus (strain DSM 6534 / IAM 12695 / TK-6) TaxID=608538 RepID=D3DHR2_HYDTT|nr:helix-turn-helix domain-containing protein [Hydrogenobacter thermophilus]ADO45299.1 Integrase catalytic region [Hydrogenobacter thermophilus TK-6]BAI69364.1 Pol protein fragment [Hydrogenobacter thermophilus TK-6]